VSIILLTLPEWKSSLELLGYLVSFLCVIWAYSSPPIRLKGRPIIDSLSNGVGCWLVWACGYTFNGDKTLLYNAEPTSICGLSILLYGAAVHSLGTVVDAEADGSTGCRTIATFYGERGAASFSLVCL
jgi:4-hydroxybenzoate polyprenyltransferase